MVYRLDIVEQIRRYRPFNEQEEMDQKLILSCMEKEADIFSRENCTAHMTAAAWTVNSDRTKILMAYHNIYNSWSWLGGHADGEEDLLSVAMREVKEESGVMTVRPVTGEIFSLEVLTVDGHRKRGAYVSSHLHLNITYLLEADENDPLFIKADENSGVSWFRFEDAMEQVSEPWMKEQIYKKLNDKLKLFNSTGK